MSIRIVANEIGPVNSRKSTKALTIDISMEKVDEERLIAIRDLVCQFPGVQPLYLRFHSPDGHEIRLKADPGYSVRDEETLRAKLTELLS